MRIVPVTALAAAALLVAACSGSTSIATSPPSPAPSTTDGEAVTRIDVVLTDALKIEPATMTVPVGTPVTFVVTNTGVIDHEFVLGDEQVQAEHEDEMMEGHMSDDATAVTVPPGETREVTTTFPEAGVTFAGCHIPGHYAGGMKATITAG